MPRPTNCPNCGASCTSHTGSYCEECGEPLVKLKPRKPFPDSELAKIKRTFGTPGARFIRDEK